MDLTTCQSIEDGVDARLDYWHAVPSDQLPEFMEREVRESDYVIIVCTPGYKMKSEDRTGGVGYEGGIMTADVFYGQNHRNSFRFLREAHGQNQLHLRKEQGGRTILKNS